MGLVSFLYKAQTLFSGRMAEGLRSGPSNHIKPRLRMGTTIPTIISMPFYGMNFNIDLSDDNYYYDSILRVRGSHACL